MTDLVPADQVEQLVGARRHRLAHLGRAVSHERTVYILHSQACRDSGIDLRSCAYSHALDAGIDGLPEWNGQHDRTVTLQVEHGCLLPDADGPADIEYVTPSEKSRPCQGRNSNVCVAEGCYGESCVASAAAPDAPTT